ncbi:NlpC/P60 family protein [Nonomuraea sp. NPDC049129]|uniref:C40 family peptidase n=1 Tax=Nonomuraea sp. NPDC049129 TaxID=3155272 RepID=UPI0033F51C5C
MKRALLLTVLACGSLVAPDSGTATAGVRQACEKGTGRCPQAAGTDRAAAGGAAAGRAATGGVAAGGAAAGGVAVRAALGMLGVPYSWGGGGPQGPGYGIGHGKKTKGFDCSGLTEYAWASAGVSIGTTTHEQWRSGARVPKEQVAPGDLVFYDSKPRRQGPEHVGLAVDGTRIVDAPFTGEVVRLDPLNKPHFMGVIRPGTVHPETVYPETVRPESARPGSALPSSGRPSSARRSSPPSGSARSTSGPSKGAPSARRGHSGRHGGSAKGGHSGRRGHSGRHGGSARHGHSAKGGHSGRGRHSARRGHSSSRRKGSTSRPGS